MCVITVLYIYKYKVYIQVQSIYIYIPLTSSDILWHCIRSHFHLHSPTSPRDLTDLLFVLARQQIFRIQLPSVGNTIFPCIAVEGVLPVAKDLTETIVSKGQQGRVFVDPTSIMNCKLWVLPMQDFLLCYQHIYTYINITVVWGANMLFK